jgi:hypothetical protein
LGVRLSDGGSRLFCGGDEGAGGAAGAEQLAYGGVGALSRADIVNG